MRKPGEIMNPRDEQGWMIPRSGTKRRKVYDALKAGKRAGEIMKEFGLSRPAYNSHRHFIVRTENANRHSYAVKHPGIRTFRRVGDEFVEVNA